MAVRKATSWCARMSDAYASPSPSRARATSSPSVSARATAVYTPAAAGGFRLIAQPVPRAAHRLELIDAERPVDLVAQVADVDVDDVRAVLVVVVPGVLEQLVAREHLAGMAHERLEQLEFLRRQGHLGFPAPHAPGGGVEPQI